MPLELRLLEMGRADVPGPELYWMSGWDEWFPLSFQVALVRGDGITALINTGPAQDLGPMNEQWIKVLGERAPMRRQEGQFITDQLAGLGIEPGDVTQVILTPLQLYTVGNLLLFEQAEICLSRQGWLHFHSTHEHPHDNRATSIPDDILVPLVTTVWPRVRLLDDADEIAPGLRTWVCGVHHRASMVVEVDTPAGLAAVSDAFFYAENVEQGIPIGISESMSEAIETYARVRRTADFIVPLYDPKNAERYPDGIVGT